MQLYILFLACLTFLLMAQDATSVPMAFERGTTAPLDRIGTVVLDVNMHKRSPEIVNIMGHSRAGEITHDVSHYFHPATPKQRLAHHMNTSKALTNPTLEQIMISDHPPFTKRNEDLNFAVAKGSPNFSEAKANKGTEFVDFVRVVSRVMGRPFQQNDEGDAGGTPIREGDPGLLKGSQDDRAMWYLSPRASHAREHHFHS